ncbi:MAG: hypothetical protein D3915_02545 [Candidatus Electrothrix sp. AU1_5]|nr:hypothetical protein [Candidatus Electrothrix gigas]
MYGRVLPACLLVGVPVGLKHGWFFFIVIMLAGLILPVPAIYLIDKISGFLMFFYNGGGTFSLNEQLAADVEKIKILKTKEKFTDALETADAVLARNPKHPETLYLKAQLLIGFERYNAAYVCLNKLIAIKNPVPDEKLRNWAITLREKVLKRIREEQELDKEI